jgi:hypothetical protein
MHALLIAILGAKNGFLTVKKWLFGSKKRHFSLAPN